MARRIIDIPLDRSPRAVDPDLSRGAGESPLPEPAQPTKGPNRLTIRVPSQGTKLSLGEGDLTDMAPWNKRPGVGTEAGIVAQTDLHAHLHTFGTSRSEAKTWVRLGVPGASVPGTSGYAPDADTGIGCLFGEAHALWSGYSMVTQGAAYQESRYNNVVVSGEGEVRVVGDIGVSIGTPGDVTIGADAEADSKELCANDEDPAAHASPGRSGAYFRVEGAAPLMAQAEELVRSFVTMAASVAKSVTARPSLARAGWAPSLRSAISDSSAAATMLFMNTGLLAAQLALPRSPGGQVSVFASRAATVSSPEAVAINAGGVASMIAGLSAAVVGGIAASVSGLVSATLSGLSAVVSGQLTSRLESVFGAAEVRSPAGVNVYSPSGPVAVTGGPLVQLNAVDGGAYVHGAAQCFIGAGPSAGMGLYAVPAALFLGNVANATVFPAPAPAVTAGISITATTVTLAMSPAVMEVTPRAATIAAPSVTIGGAESVTIGAPATFLTGGPIYLG